MELMHSVDQAADWLIEKTNRRIVMGLPLGLGKPNQLVNALFQKACDDSSIRLEVYTALSLQKPQGKTDLEKRFLNEFVERVYGDYVELDYIQAVHRNKLPENISVYEFFVKPGGELNHTYSQQHYLSSNYTHVARDINSRKFNVLAQMLAVDEASDSASYSLSCNAEVTLDLLPMVEQRRAQGEDIFLIGQVNQQLPFIENHAEVSGEQFDLIIDDPSCHTSLFSTPNMPVNMTEHFIGLNASSLIKDGGTLQIGIGALGDAVAYATLLREQDNSAYKDLLEQSGVQEKFSEVIDSTGGTETFAEGLYGCSEMFTYGLMRLIEEKVIRRTVKDDQGRDILLHGGFFLGPNDFYSALKNLDKSTREKIDLLNISFVNQLYGNEEIKRQHRVAARFINTAFSATLMGAAVADQLEDGRVLSGVGGQYNFVAQAHELEDARSILLLRATRSSQGEVTSNILWSYGHTTIPRHLRDMVVTEYGIADLRGKSDSEVIKAMLNICDSRFQSELLEKAKAVGKVESDYEIPELFQHNLPGTLHKLYKQSYDKGYFPDFPLGSDFTAHEQDLLKALSWLKANAKPSRFLQLARQLHISDEDEEKFTPHLKRVGLDEPHSLKQRIFRQLVLSALSATS